MSEGDSDRVVSKKKINRWPSLRAKKVLKVFERHGWAVRKGGNHRRVLIKSGFRSLPWQFRDTANIDGFKIAEIAKKAKIPMEAFA